MKKSLILLLLYLSVNWCIGAEKLPEVPWRAIVESTKGKTIYKWETDISVKLFGNYTQSDSLMVVNAISELNQLTKTIHINMSSHDRGNMEIFFIDSTNISYYKETIPYINYKKSFSFNSYSSFSNKLNLLTQIIYTKQIPENSKQNFITNTLAFDLIPNFWFSEYYYNRNLQSKKIQEIIFRSINVARREKLFQKGMPDFDKILLKTVYSPDFEEKLKIAKKQFGHRNFIPDWLKVSPYAVLITIFLFLVFPIIAISKKLTNRTIWNISSKFSKYNIQVLVRGFFFSILLSFLITMYRRKSVYFSLEEIIYTILIGAMAILVIGILSINLLKYLEILIYKNINSKQLRVGLIFLSTGLIPFCALSIVLITTKYPGTKDFEFLIYVFIACMTLAAFRALISYFIFKEKDLIFENETKLSRLRELKTKAELAALHSRINPHFLYNSLNSIAGLAHEDANKTEHMALSLSKLFRYSINRDQSDWTTLKEEAEMIKIYLDVEKVRFDDRLDYYIEIPEDLEDHRIPRFIIQPLVENAVKHGLSKSMEKGEIKIKAAQEGRKISIAVSDNGPDFPTDLIPGFGIQSIYDKLEILYKDKFEMSFINSPNKQVLIKLS